MPPSRGEDPSRSVPYDQYLTQEYEALNGAVDDWRCGLVKGTYWQRDVVQGSYHYRQQRAEQLKKRQAEQMKEQLLLVNVVPWRAFPVQERKQPLRLANGVVEKGAVGGKHLTGSSIRATTATAPATAAPATAAPATPASTLAVSLGLPLTLF
eukprot:gene2741-3378_t